MHVAVHINDDADAANAFKAHSERLRFRWSRWPNYCVHERKRPAESRCAGAWMRGEPLLSRHSLYIALRTVDGVWRHHWIRRAVTFRIETG